MHHSIRLRGAREHNLRGVDLDLERGRWIAVTGRSGSGKTSLVFDTLVREGQHRYLGALSARARQFFGRLGRARLRSLDGMPPAIAIGSDDARAGARSTVGTASGLSDLLRLLFARTAIDPGGEALTRSHFSFNHPRGQCEACAGRGIEDRVAPDLLVADPTKSLRDGALRPTLKNGYTVYSQVTLDVMNEICRAHGFDVHTPWAELTDEQRNVIFQGTRKLEVPFGKHGIESRMKWEGITARPRETGFYRGLIPVIEETLKRGRNPNILKYVRSRACSECGGTRLARAGREARVGEWTLPGLGALPARELIAAVDSLPTSHVLTATRRSLDPRLTRLVRLGLGHLALERDSASLSTGEAQRLRLAAQANAALGGLVVALDEPTLGLHPEGQAGMAAVLEELRALGNTLLVVEHDPDMARRADHLLTLGPGAGVDGGRLVHDGPPGEHPLGPPPVPKAERRAARAHLVLRGARKHNLRATDFDVALGTFQVVVGPSGAGKSTLVFGTLLPALAGEADARAFFESLETIVADTPDAPFGEGLDRGAGERRGARESRAAHRTRGSVDPNGTSRVHAVDARPIGRSSRSTPATWSGLFDRVRKAFAETPEALAAGLRAGHFSYNNKEGRCETCEGLGALRVGLHLLEQLELPCPACEGARYRPEVLAVRLRDKSIADVLAASVDEVLPWFEADPEAHAICAAMHTLGLGHLPLGMPSTRLSRGEGQRVKLATLLGQTGAEPSIVVLDEPDRGLHPGDIAQLVGAIDALVDAGHTVVAITHHRHLWAAADGHTEVRDGVARTVDASELFGRTQSRESADGVESSAGALNREGDSEARTSASRDSTAAEAETTHSSGSGLAPLEVGSARSTRPTESVHSTVTEDAPRAAAHLPDAIELRGVRTHNLQSIDVRIPHGQITAIVGPSGSGKSSLAFDTLAAEAWARYAESLPFQVRRFVRQSARPELDDVRGLGPVMALAQGQARAGRRSTVATQSELGPWLRLLWSRAGTLDGEPCGLSAEHFSPDRALGACRACSGLGLVPRASADLLITNPERALTSGALDGTRVGRYLGEADGQFLATLRAAGPSIDWSTPWEALSADAKRLALDGAGDAEFSVRWEFKRGKRSGEHHFEGRWEGLLALAELEVRRRANSRQAAEWAAALADRPCESCGGERLDERAREVRVGPLRLPEVLAARVDDLPATIEALRAAAPAIVDELRPEVERRARDLVRLGLGHLRLDRQSGSLSSGELQRVRLASVLRSGSSGLTIVLDEPSRGLHPRDVRALAALLIEFRDAGNTIVVVEHERELVRAADHVLELGPGAGSAGGRLVASGTPSEWEARLAASLAASAKSDESEVAPAKSSARVAEAPAPSLRLRGARAHNLRDLDIHLPSRGFVVLTGVSGSGKSSFLFDVLGASFAAGRPIECDAIEWSGGSGSTDSPAPSSAAAPSPFDYFRDLRSARAPERARTVLAALDLLGPLQKLYHASAKRDPATADLPRAAFSHASPAGRCPACGGSGRERVAMDFMADLELPCPECEGRRFRPEVLAVKWRERDVAQFLAEPIEALGDELPEGPLREAARELERLGLGYLSFGRRPAELSGGERVRVQLASRLRATGGPTLFLLDEPAAGLHELDIERLQAAIARLVARGDLVVAAEHRTALIARADQVVELGPEGGERGGALLSCGPFVRTRTFPPSQF